MRMRARKFTPVTLLVATLITLSVACSVAAATVSPSADAATSRADPRGSYADMVDRVAPAVVTIHSAHRVRAPQQYPFPDDPYFRQFFGAPNRTPPQESPSQLQDTLGSGVIVSADGNILTNQHVVDGAEQISVELSDRRAYKARLIGSDAASDLALLKIDARDLPVLPLGDSDKVRVGDVCLAVGNPLGIGETVTAGIISARGRATGLSDGSFEDFLQTDAAINEGNSGGALVNTRGELIGINSQIISTSGGSIGIGFAIPSNMASNVLLQLKAGGRVRRGNLGIAMQNLTPELIDTLKLLDLRGVLVNSVDAQGPADRAGIRPGDVITAMNGVRIDDPNALRNKAAAFVPDTQVHLTVVHEGREHDVVARLSELPSNQEAAQGSRGGVLPGGRLGVFVSPLTSDAAARRGLPPSAPGVLVTEVFPSGPAAAVGLRVQDVILEVNHQPVRSAPDLRAALHAASSGPVFLLVNRDGRNIFLVIGSQ